MSENVTSRFIKCVDYLREHHVIRSLASFASDIGTHRQTLNDILKGRREVRVGMIEQAITKYYFNPHYIFSGTGEMFDKQENHEEDEINNIKLVPIKAQAGYSDHILDPIFQEDLPTFQMPFDKFKNGAFVAFEIEGDSMYPTLDEGDIVVCSKLAPQYYAHTIKDEKVYVVVSQEEVLVKRVNNLIHKSKSLLCRSDNNTYKDISIKLKHVKEVWKVEGALKMSLPKLRRTDYDLEQKLQDLISKYVEVPS